MIIRITREDTGHYSEKKCDDDIDAQELVEELKQLLVSFGYHPHTVDDMFDEEYRWTGKRTK